MNSALTVISMILVALMMVAISIGFIYTMGKEIESLTNDDESESLIDCFKDLD